MDEAIITTIAKQSAADVFEVLTSLFIARIDQIELAQFVGDCADEAQSLGLSENERLFRLAELMLGGGTLGTPEFAEQCSNHIALILAAYKAQKSLNMHRAPREIELAAPTVSAENVADVPPETADVLPSEPPSQAESPAPQAPAEIAQVEPEPQVRRRQTKKKK
jgi:hypothetical protein